MLHVAIVGHRVKTTNKTIIANDNVEAIAFAA